MHQHVQIQRLLLTHAAGDFLLHRGLVAGIVHPAGLVLATCQADFRRLREGADGGGGIRRQIQNGRLFLCPHGMGAEALVGAQGR